MDSDRQGRRIRLLMVDDEDDFLRASAAALERRGFDVATAGDAAGAVLVLETREMDAAVLDVKMPGMKGDELFRLIRRRWPSLPVIMLTGHGTVEQAFSTSREGVFEYLAKPTDIDELAAVVRRAVDAGREPVGGAGDAGEPGAVSVLLVDDEDDFLRATAAALERRGFDVATAGDAAAAVLVLETREMDAAVLDVKMPGMKGDDLFRLIHRRWPALPVIMLTGHGTVEQAFSTSREGVFKYLAKPTDIDKLAAVVRRAVEAGREPVGGAGGAGEPGAVSVLLVDDEALYLESAASGLRRRGLEVVAASTASEALEAMERTDFPVVVLDMHLPGVQGLEVFDRLRMRRPLTRVIMLTGRPSVQSVMGVMKKGAFDYLTKPVDLERLAGTIRAAAAERDGEEERERRRQVAEACEGRTD